MFANISTQTLISNEPNYNFMQPSGMAMTSKSILELSDAIQTQTTIAPNATCSFGDMLELYVADIQNECLVMSQALDQSTILENVDMEFTSEGSTQITTTSALPSDFTQYNFAIVTSGWVQKVDILSSSLGALYVLGHLTYDSNALYCIVPVKQNPIFLKVDGLWIEPEFYCEKYIRLGQNLSIPINQLVKMTYSLRTFIHLQATGDCEVILDDAHIHLTQSGGTPLVCVGHLTSAICTIKNLSRVPNSITLIWGQAQ